MNDKQQKTSAAQQIAAFRRGEVVTPVFDHSPKTYTPDTVPYCPDKDYVRTVKKDYTYEERSAKRILSDPVDNSASVIANTIIGYALIEALY